MLADSRTALWYSHSLLFDYHCIAFAATQHAAFILCNMPFDSPLWLSMLIRSFNDLNPFVVSYVRSVLFTEHFMEINSAESSCVLLNYEFSFLMIFRILNELAFHYLSPCCINEINSSGNALFWGGMCAMMTKGRAFFYVNKQWQLVS
jgi:hypothetical protein